MDIQYTAMLSSSLNKNQSAFPGKPFVTLTPFSKSLWIIEDFAMFTSIPSGTAIDVYNLKVNLFIYGAITEKQDVTYERQVREGHRICNL